MIRLWCNGVTPLRLLQTLTESTTTEGETPVSTKVKSTKVMRVPADVQEEAAQVAALRRQQAGELLADAWREYMVNHREEFAADLREAAELLRNGTLDELSTFASRNAKARAQAETSRIRSKHADK